MSMVNIQGETPISSALKSPKLDKKTLPPKQSRPRASSGVNDYPSSTAEEFTPWDQTLTKANPDRDVLELLAQRAFEPLSPSPYKLELTPMVPPTANPKLHVIEESKREGSPGAATKKMEMLFKKRQPVQFTLNTGQCRSELELIQFVAEINGFQETQNGAMGNLVWYGLALTPKDIELI